MLMTISSVCADSHLMHRRAWLLPSNSAQDSVFAESRCVARGEYCNLMQTRMEWRSARVSPCVNSSLRWFEERDVRQEVQIEVPLASFRTFSAAGPSVSTPAPISAIAGSSRCSADLRTRGSLETRSASSNPIPPRQMKMFIQGVMDYVRVWVLSAAVQMQGRGAGSSSATDAPVT